MPCIRTHFGSLAALLAWNDCDRTCGVVSQVVGDMYACKEAQMQREGNSEEVWERSSVQGQEGKRSEAYV